MGACRNISDDSSSSAPPEPQRCGIRNVGSALRILPHFRGHECPSRRNAKVTGPGAPSLVRLTGFTGSNEVSIAGMEGPRGRTRAGERIPGLKSRASLPTHPSCAARKLPRTKEEKGPGCFQLTPEGDAAIQPRRRYAGVQPPTHRKADSRSCHT